MITDTVTLTEQLKPFRAQLTRHSVKPISLRRFDRFRDMGTMPLADCYWLTCASGILTFVAGFAVGEQALQRAP